MRLKAVFTVLCISLLTLTSVSAVSVARDAPTKDALKRTPVKDAPQTPYTPEQPPKKSGGGSSDCIKYEMTSVNGQQTPVCVEYEQQTKYSCPLWHAGPSFCTLHLF